MVATQDMHICQENVGSNLAVDNFRHYFQKRGSGLYRDQENRPL